MLTEPTAAAHTMGGTEHLSGTNDYSVEESGMSGPFGGQLTRVGFIVVVTICSLVVLVALLLFAYTMVRRHDRLSGYLPGPMGGKVLRKSSHRPLVPPASPDTAAAANTGSINGTESLDEKPNQESLSSCSPTSPPPYQETMDQDGKQV